MKYEGMLILSEAYLNDLFSTNESIKIYYYYHTTQFYEGNQVPVLRLSTAGKRVFQIQYICYPVTYFVYDQIHKNMTKLTSIQVMQNQTQSGQICLVNKMSNSKDATVFWQKHFLNT